MTHKFEGSQAMPYKIQGGQIMRDMPEESHAMIFRTKLGYVMTYKYEKGHKIHDTI